MPVKVLWDYTYYWGILCQLFFQKRLTDRRIIGKLGLPLRRARDLNAAVQRTLQDWGRSRPDTDAQVLRAPAMLDQANVPWFAALNHGLRDVLDDAAFEARIHVNVAQLEALAHRDRGDGAADAHDDVRASASNARRRRCCSGWRHSGASAAGRRLPARILADRRRRDWMIAPILVLSAVRKQLPNGRTLYATLDLAVAPGNSSR